MSARMEGIISCVEDATILDNLLEEIEQDDEEIGVEVKFFLTGLGPTVEIVMRTPFINRLFIGTILLHASSFFDISYVVNITF
jgi:hypothetical protein